MNPNNTNKPLDDKPKGETRLLKGQNSTFRDFFRHIRLLLPFNLIGRAFGWKSSKEQRKVAVYQSRNMAVLISLLHLVPLTGAITLLVLHWSRYWVGGTSDNGTSFQFAAKVHELSMQTSLVDVLLYIIRAQALDGYLPLGVLAGVAQAPQLSYLWSLDFIAALGAPAFRMWHKVTFGLTISILLLLTATVGPTSAVLMIPRPEMPHTNETKTRYLNVSEASLFPTHVNASDVLEMQVEHRSCLVNPANTRRSARQNGTGNGVPIQIESRPDGERRYKYLWCEDEGGFTYGPFKRVAMYLDYPQSHPKAGLWTIGTIPTLLSTLQLSYDIKSTRYGDTEYPHLQIANANWTLQTSQPIIMSACSTVVSSIEDVFYFRTDDTTVLLRNAPELYNRFLSANPRDYLLWALIPEDSASFVELFESVNPSSINNLQYQTCTVSILWWTSVTSLYPSDMGYVVQNEWSKSRKALDKNSLKPSIIGSDSVSKNSTDLWRGVGASPKEIVRHIMDNLARLPGRSGSNGGFDVFQTDVVKGYNWSAISDATSHTTINIDATIRGFGYGSIKTTTRISLAVIIAYCATTIMYIAYIAATGRTSIAWNSATELIMLALQSKEPGSMGHVSVGIGSMETFRRSVGIRVHTVKTEDTGDTVEKLELVFEIDQDDGRKMLTKVERNKAY